MHPLLKTSLSKLNFALGRNPQVEKRGDWRSFVPEPYKAVFTLSADFELAWAWRFSKGCDDPVKLALKKARLARANMPELIQLCDQYKVPVTWATVGHLFLEECSCGNGLPHPDMKRIGHFENGYWKFAEGDWYKNDPCSNVKDAPEWYCPDLLDMIEKSPVNHEIGCHTFSHIDCRDGVCPPEVFRQEMEECQKLAKQRGIDLKTFIYPAHTVGNVKELPALGFSNYRTNLGNILGYPVKHENGLWEIKSSFQLEWRKDWSPEYHIKRTNTIIDRAIKNNSVCHFWFHPSFEREYVEEVLPAVLDHLNKRRNDIQITTMEDYVNWLNASQNVPLVKKVLVQ